MPIVIIWIIFCFVVGSIAKNKTLGFWGGFFLSLILSPLIGLIFALISKPKDSKRDNQGGYLKGNQNVRHKRSNVSTYRKPPRKKK